MVLCVLLFSPRCRYANCSYVPGCCNNNSHNAEGAIMMNIVMLSVLASLRSTQITFHKLAPLQKYFLFAVQKRASLTLVNCIRPCMTILR